MLVVSSIIYVGNVGTVAGTIVPDPHHLDADPDPAFHFDAVPCLTLHFDEIRLPKIMRIRIRNTRWYSNN